MAESRNLFLAVEEALSASEGHETQRRVAHILQAIMDAGWHLVSTPTVQTKTDYVPVPIWGEGEVTRIDCVVDRQRLTLTNRTCAVELALARPEYHEMRMRDLGSRFARQVGHAIGLPGCDGEVPF